MFEIQDVAYIGTSKLVDTLVIVAYNADLFVRGCKEFQQIILRKVRILKLIDKNI